MAAQILRRQKAAEDAEQIANYLAKDSLDTAIRFLENAESTFEQFTTAETALRSFTAYLFRPT